MFLYLFMYSLQQRIGKKILAVFNSKGKCMSPPSASCISLSINFKTAKFPQTKPFLPWFSILTFPQRQACLFFQEFRRGFATVLTFCIIFFLLHLEKKEKKKKAWFWNDSKNALFLWSDVDCICLCISRLVRGTRAEFSNPWCIEEPYIDYFFVFLWLHHHV